MSGAKIIYFMYHHYQHCITTLKSTQSPTSTDTFTLFPLLPPEIRLKIWQTIAAEPQTVELSCTPSSSYLPNGRWFSHSKPPAIFSICSESRAVALAQYTILTFSPDQIGVPWPRLYLNFSVDTLWLCKDLCATSARDLLEKNQQLQKQLRFLVVEEKLWKVLNPITFTPSPIISLSGLGVDDMKSRPITDYLEALENLSFASSV